MKRVHLSCLLAVSVSVSPLVVAFQAGFSPKHGNVPIIHRHPARPFQLYSTKSPDQKGTNNKDNLPSKKNTAIIINARYVAVMALMDATGAKKKEAFALRRLENDRNYSDLDPRDRRFARALVSTVERRKGQIDKILTHCMDKSLTKARRKSDSMVQAALAVGVAQILFLDVPSYAAVKETVEVLRMDPTIKVPESMIKFVNAILRRVERERDQLESITTPNDNIAPWLQDEWRKSWGEDKLAAITDAAMKESPVYLWVYQEQGSTHEQKLQTLQSTKVAFQEHATTPGDSHGILSDKDNDADDDWGVEILSHGSVYIDKSYFPGQVSKWPLYNEGKWWVQDAAASLPALALHGALTTDSTDNQQQHIVDLCAAPGGKTAQLLSLGFPSVTAVEVSPRRAKQLESNLARLGMLDRCTINVADGCDWIPEQGLETAAGVLCDVPCSATGTASRRPDVLRKAKDLDSLLETQFSLATHCVDNILAPGGILIFATCSLLRQESEEQVQKLLDRKEGALVKTIPFEKGEIPGFDDAIDEHGNLRVIPGWLPGKLSSCDGFFVARLQKQ